MVRKLYLFCKTYKNKSPLCFYNLIPGKMKIYSTRSNQVNNISNVKYRSDFFSNFFSPASIIEWNKLDRDILNTNSLNIFKLLLLKIVGPMGNSIFDKK